MQLTIGQKLARLDRLEATATLQFSRGEFNNAMNTATARRATVLALLRLGVCPIGDRAQTERWQALRAECQVQRAFWERRPWSPLMPTPAEQETERLSRASPATLLAVGWLSTAHRALTSA